MKKILIVTFSMSVGGLENVLMSYFRNLDRKLYQLDFLINKSELESEYIKEIKLNGGQIFYIETPGQLGPIRYVRKLKAIIEKNGPYSVVHSNTEYHGGLVCLAAKKAKIKIRICHSHTTSVGKKRNMKLMPIYKFLIKKYSTKNIACSSKAGEFLFNNHFDVLPNAIDIDKFQTINYEEIEKIMLEFNFKNNDLIIGHVGRFSNEKNHKFMIDILAEVVKHKPNCFLVFVGDGLLKDEIISYADTKKVNENLKFAGIRNNVEDFLHVFDCLLLPSLYEGLPVTIIEGQASGIKCYISNSITKEVDLGLELVEFLGIDQVESWVLKVLENGERKNLNKNEIRKKFAEKNYDIKITIEKLISFYNKNN